MRQIPTRLCLTLPLFCSLSFAAGQPALAWAPVRSPLLALAQTQGPGTSRLTTMSSALDEIQRLWDSTQPPTGMFSASWHVENIFYALRSGSPGGVRIQTNAARISLSESGGRDVDLTFLNLLDAVAAAQLGQRPELTRILQGISQGAYAAPLRPVIQFLQAHSSQKVTAASAPAPVPAPGAPSPAARPAGAGARRLCLLAGAPWPQRGQNVCSQRHAHPANKRHLPLHGQVRHLPLQREQRRGHLYGWVFHQSHARAHLLDQASEDGADRHSLGVCQ